MKLLNYTSSWFLMLLLFAIPLWAGIFYYTILNEIYDSMDDGLDNQKLLVIQKAHRDSSILGKRDFEESDYAFQPVSEHAALNYHDTYVDTLMYMQNEEEFEPVRMLKSAFRLNGKYYQLRVITSMVEEDDLVSTLLYALAELYAALVITILSLNKLLIKRVWKPFYQLMAQLQRFNLSSTETFSPPPTRIDEFKILNSTLTELIHSNQRVFQNQKQFTENAAHELQTPLAISINKLESLAQEADLKPEQAGYLESAMKNLERIRRLNQSLLLLSKIENRQFEDGGSTDMRQVVVQLLDDMAEQAAFMNLNLRFDAKEELNWRIPKGLAEILVINLLKNALNHNVSGGWVQMAIEQGQLIISNTSGNDELDRRHLFQRFYKGTSSENGTGLGLAIVHAITKLYGISIQYSYNQHERVHQFILSQ